MRVGWAGALAATLAMAASGLATAGSGASVRDTRHNLSVTGPGPVRATGEDEICLFCHAPHVEDATAPLWNHETSGKVQYRPYESPTLSTRVGQPDGVSLQCLSCHDGTIAVGAVGNRDEPVRMQGTGAFGRLRADDPANLGTDLSGTHPVSLRYDEAATARGREGDVTRLRSDPVRLASGTLLDAKGKVQCTSCHDAHADPAAGGAPVPPFWRGGTYEEVCEACHLAPLAHGAHDDPAQLPRSCGSCHAGHGAPRQPLLPKAEEESCFACHGDAADRDRAEDAGVVATRTDAVLLRDVFTRAYRHPVDQTSGVHDPTEDLLAEGAAAPRHVECVDCHATHEAPLRAAYAGVPATGAPRVSGLGPDTEADVCYACHSTNANLPYGATDKSDEFDPSNKSYHPVEAPTAGADVPSLLYPWRPGDRMTCSDCHGGDQPDDPAGPHGSSNPWLLKHNYTATDGNPESQAAYAACYACHSRTTILKDATWPGHSEHVVVGEVSCYACHDSHGSPDNPGLIRFGKDIRYGRVAPSKSGRLQYDASTGRCWVSCHDVDHDALGYP